MSISTPIIAVLTDWYYHYQAQSVNYVADELKKAGYGVLCITAGELQDSSQHSPEHLISNSIYSEVNNFGFHGLISLSGTFGNRVPAEDISRFLKGFTLPTVSLGLEVPGVTSVYCNHSAGMSNLMQHLIVDRNIQDIVFIRGLKHDPYSQQREEIFRESLIEHGHDSGNIHYLDGDYNTHTTYRLVTEFLSHNKNVGCIVAANDVMGVSAARAAKAQYLSIPDDILISGFDDTSEATSHSPALTTVRQPLKKMTTVSIQLLLQQIAGASSTKSKNSKTKDSSGRSVSIDSELVIRGSTCNIRNRKPISDSTDPEALGDFLVNGMLGLKSPENILLSDIAHALAGTLRLGTPELLNLTSGISIDCLVEHQHWWKNLCDHIENISDQLIEQNLNVKNIALLGTALSKIRKRIWAIEMDQSFASSRMDSVRSKLQLSMSSSNCMEDIITAMNDWLTDINPKRCYLACYKNVGDTPDATAQLIHAYSQEYIPQAAYESFVSSDILPESIRHELSTGLLVFSPVYTQNMLFGYLLIDPTDINLHYIDTAALTIGNAMRTQHHVSALQVQKESLQSVNSELNKLAKYDALTGLANRFQFQEKLKSYTKNQNIEKYTFSLLFIDLDGFKHVNDTLGHDIGDELLVQVAKVLKEKTAVGPGVECSASRLGGDEFTVMIKNGVDVNYTRVVSEGILDGLTNSFKIGEYFVDISASIGCATFPCDASDSNTLIKFADLAMYHAKNSGKNRIAFFDQSMITADTEELQLAEELRNAVKNNELCMYYQPRVDLETGDICSAEALMRWISPTGGGHKTRACPDVFIRLAEKIGVISQLYTFSLHSACKQAAKWALEGTPLIVSVNVSVEQLQQEKFFETVKNCLEQYQLDPGLLELEITETTAMTDVELNIRNLTRIKEAGILVSIDDFGTGYSSLNYLKRLPINHLKVDRSFIADIEDANANTPDAAIVRSIVSIGKSLNIVVIAEGIETRAQHDFLKSLGCDQVQGYLYSKPLPESEFSSILQRLARQPGLVVDDYFNKAA